MNGRDAGSLRAIAVAWLLITSIAPNPSPAALIVTDRDGNVLVQGDLTTIAGRINGYDVPRSAPTGLGSFDLDASPPSGTTSIPNASSVTNAHVDATINANSQDGTLTMHSNASVFANVTGTPRDTAPPDRAIGVAFGSASFGLNFNIDRISEYVITSALSVGAQEIFNPFGKFARAEAQITGPGGFSQSRLLNCDGCDVNEGASFGSIGPGGYSMTGSVVAGLNSFDGTSANATYQLSLSVMPASHWINTAGGSFQVAGNWSAPIIPGSNDAAVFDLPGTYTVTLDESVTNQRLRANGAGLNFDLDLNGFEYTADDVAIGGLDGDNVSVTFDDSSQVVSAASTAAARSAGQGTGGVTGAGRLSTRLVNAGKGGSATVKADISSAIGQIAGDGSVRITDTGRWNVDDLTVGLESRGLLDVSAGGGLTTRVAVLGEGRSFRGTAIVGVTGPGSFWDNQILFVGKAGSAVMLVHDKSIVSAHQIVIGAEVGSQGILEVDNASLLANTGFQPIITVGSGGSGTLEVKNGALVETELLTMGTGTSSTANLTVESLGELRVHTLLQVRGRLTVDGGSVESPDTGSLGIDIERDGVLDVRRGHVYERIHLDVLGTLALDRNNGSASVGRNRVESPGRLTIGPEGILVGTGIIKGHVTVLPGGLNEFGGTVRPGNSPGTLTIDGDYEQDGGLLGIEVAGTLPGQFDVLAVTGNVMLGGMLSLEFVDGFAPHKGDVFKFLDVGGATSGAFEQLAVRNLLPGFQFDLHSDAGGLTLVALNNGVYVPEPESVLLMIMASLGCTLAVALPRHKLTNA